MGKSSQAASFVLDGSVTLAWFFEDEANAYCDSVADSLAAAIAVVPSLWPLEIANAVLVGERRRRTTEAKAARFIGLLGALPIEWDGETAFRAWNDTLSLARTHGLSVYDAAYLELARRRSLPIATVDKELRTAAAKLGVASYHPI